MAICPPRIIIAEYALSCHVKLHYVTRTVLTRLLIGTHPYEEALLLDNTSCEAYTVAVDKLFLCLK